MQKAETKDMIPNYSTLHQMLLLGNYFENYLSILTVITKSGSTACITTVYGDPKPQEPGS
jgi:hypothetical protein